MKSYSIPQMKTVTGNTPQEAAMLFNESMMELAPMRPTFVREGNVYYIQYLVEWFEAENTAEEHQLKGEYDKCYSCPFCVKDLNRFGQIDTRKKWATCSKTGKRTRIDGSVCDEFYKGKEA